MIKHIKSMIPADGWWAIYLEDKEPWFIKSRVVCFAAVRKITWEGKHPYDKEVEEELDEVVALDGGTEFEDVSECTNFHVVIHDSEITDEITEGWIQAARARAIAQKAAR